MFNDIFSTLTPDTLILTANKRLTIRIAHEYYQYQTQQQKTAWETLDILPFNSWLQRLWETQTTTHNALTLLHPFQEQAIWQDLIEQSSNNDLLNIPATIQQARAAWQLVKEWNLDLDDPQLQQTQDGRMFIQWAKRFAAICKKNNWLDQASLLEHIQSQILQNNYLLPKKIQLIGYLELTPALQTFVNHLQTRTHLVTPEKPSTSSAVYQYHASDTDTEIQTMARWAKNAIENNQNTTIGCIIPELNTLRPKLERIFYEVFGSTQHYNIASGTPLSHEPMIEIGLSLLSLPYKTLTMEEIGHLLRSPFLGGGIEEYAKRALLDKDLRKLGNTHYSLKTLLKTLSNITLTECPLLTHRLQNLAQLEQASSQLPSEWSLLFNQILSIMGWPGDRTLNSREYQTRQHWQNSLLTLNTLDLFNKRYTFSHAIEQLRTLLFQTLFQAQSHHEPIQILGLLESIAQPFTNTWVMGLDSKHFPAHANPNPFIPISVQRQLKMPHADADREREYAHLLLNEFIHHTDQIVFSYPEKEQDQVLEASPLIESFPKFKLDDLPPSSTSAEQLFKQKAIETIIDSQAPTIQPTEKIRGGTAIFKHQAACPFRAFAESRLQAEKLENCETGLNALERGSLLHNALELIWKEIKTQTNLMQLPEKTLKHLIDKHIDLAVQKTLASKLISKSLIELEKQYLKKVIERWMQIEKERPPFEVIACEKWMKTHIGKLTIRTKIDRIDKLDDNKYLLIDYKSGNTDIRSWLGERPEEPQLPLYMITSEQPIHAIAFAQLKPKEICFKGISIEKDLLPGIKTLEELKCEHGWPEQSETWKMMLEKLSRDFCEGKAAVDPKDEIESCRYCALKTFCRIYEVDQI